MLMIADADDERCGSGQREFRKYANAYEGRCGKAQQ